MLRANGPEGNVATGDYIPPAQIASLTTECGVAGPHSVRPLESANGYQTASDGFSAQNQRLSLASSSLADFW